MASPAELRYTKDHEWARRGDDGNITVGITDHAQDALGDVVFVELPAVGDRVDAEQQFGTVESVKTVSDLFAPLAGEVVAVNEDLADAPEQVNASPYEAGWMITIKPADAGAFDALLDAAAYDALLAEEG